MSDQEQAVFVSCSWGGESDEIVNQIDQALHARGIQLVRDKRDLGYKGSISEFIKRIGRGNCVIVIISDEYLRSKDRMSELVEIDDGKEFHDRIFPVVLNDADIYDPIKRLEYVKFWEGKRNELAKAMKEVDPANLQGIREDMDLYDRIRDRISTLTSTLKDMNTLTPEKHRNSNFSEMYTAIEKQMKEAAAAPAGVESRPLESVRSSVDNSISTGDIQVGGSIEGNLVIGNTNIYYSSPAPVSIEKIEPAYYEPETILIREGKFWMGSNPMDGVPQFETGQHEVFLPAFRIGKYPVTNQEFEFYVRKKKISVPKQMNWDGQKVRAGKERHPVTGVTWMEAMAYCRWLSEETGREYTLPNEAQWEKACRGGARTIYPWGDEYDPRCTNQGQAGLAKVNAYPEQNAYGIHDLVGNVRQWTCTLWGENEFEPDPRYVYPWEEDGRNNLDETRLVWRVLRGSSFQDEPALLRCSARFRDSPESRGYPRYGFRVVINEK